MIAQPVKINCQSKSTAVSLHNWIKPSLCITRQINKGLTRRSVFVFSVFTGGTDAAVEGERRLCLVHRPFVRWLFTMSSQTLPLKEQGVFKSVVRMYESKLFKKAVKSADLILKKHPDHGETLAMKGLTLNALDRKEEAHDLVRRGLKLNMRSHVCWHVYGLLYRSDHDYFQAARSYVNALRLDPDNKQILRDLALLQVQIRDYEGFEESRRKLLTLQPSQKTNWLGVAISFHLQKNYDKTLEVVNSWLKTLTNDALKQQDPFEHSELLLYSVSVLEESGDHAAALKLLDEDTPSMVDWLAVRETRARLLTSLGRHEEASKVLRRLIAVNPDNHAYHRDLRASVAESLPSGADDAARLESDLRICDEVTKDYPHSRAGMRISLILLPSGDHPQFMSLADNYIRPFLRRGVPALFSDLKGLYSDPSKVTAIFSLFQSYGKGLEASPPALPALLPLPAVEASRPNGDAFVEKDAEVDPEMARLWVHHFLAQHYDRIGKFETALTEIDKALAHPESVVECQMVKAEVLKHCGDTTEALAIADGARQADLSDRFVNSESTKYALLADNVPQAESWISLFTRDGDSGGVQALYDMQCIWYELGAAESHLRCGQIAQALKKFMAVERHFIDMIEDQFDFHSYCLRKVTLRSYVQMLRMEDQLRSHVCYERAATGVVRCLLRLNDMPAGERAATADGATEIPGFSNMSEAEQKKALSKKKKRDAKKRAKEVEEAAAKVVESKKVEESKGNGTTDVKSSKKDESSSNAKKSSAAEKAKNLGWMDTDVEGLEHVKSLLADSAKDLSPLGEATKRIRLLEQFEAGRMITHALSFELSIRKGLYLQGLRAVRRAKAIEADHPDALFMAVQLVHEIEGKGKRKDFSPETESVFKSLGDVLGGTNVVEMVDEYVRLQEGKASRLVGAGEVMLWMARADIPGTSIDKSMQFIADTLRGSGCIPSSCSAPHDDSMFVSVDYCAALWRRLLLIKPVLSQSNLDLVRDALLTIYPRATAFASTKSE